MFVLRRELPAVCVCMPDGNADPYADEYGTDSDGDGDRDPNPDCNRDAGVRVLSWWNAEWSELHQAAQRLRMQRDVLAGEPVLFGTGE